MITCISDTSHVILEELLPLVVDSDSILRVGESCANLSANVITYTEYDGVPDTSPSAQNHEMGLNTFHNSSGKYYFHPSKTVPWDMWGIGSGSVNRASIASFHSSPNKDYIPTLATDSSGNEFCTNGERLGDRFAPLLKPGVSHYHDRYFAGTDVEVEFNNTPNLGWWPRVILTDYATRRYWTAYNMSAYFLLLVNGTINFWSAPIYSDVRIRPTSLSNEIDDAFVQKAKMTTHLQNGNSRYILVKTDPTFYSANEIPYDFVSSNSENYQTFNLLKYTLGLASVDMPCLCFTLGKSSSVQFTSFGWTLWASYCKQPKIF